ncbi:hypothetical protein ANANG_G00169630, partial [Anguilla anguilla]
THTHLQRKEAVCQWAIKKPCVISVELVLHHVLCSVDNSSGAAGVQCVRDFTSAEWNRGGVHCAAPQMRKDQSEDQASWSGQRTILMSSY